MRKPTTDYTELRLCNLWRRFVSVDDLMLAVRAGFQHNLDASVLFVLEHFVSPRRLVETHNVRHHEARIDLAVLDHL